MAKQNKKPEAAGPKIPRVVIDTCVLIDAMVAKAGEVKPEAKESLALRVLAHCLQHYRLCFTEATLQEFKEVALDRRRRVERRPTQALARQNFVGWVCASAKRVEPLQCLVQCADPKDQKILEASASVRAAFLITYDGHILSLRGKSDKPGYTYIHPKDFMREVDAAARKTAKSSPVQGFKQRGHRNASPPKPQTVS